MAKYGLYEPLYRAGQELSGDAFLPWEIADNRAASWREFRILVDMYRQGVHRRHAATGLFSPKFSLKAKITADEFTRFADGQPDFDVCFINPFPQLPYWSFNAWMQGEHVHPGLSAAAQALLDVSGIGWNLERVPRQNAGVLAYCNFWIGTPRFWDAYVGGVLVPIAEFLETNPEHPAARAVMIDTTHTDSAHFLPFIVERLFSTYLSFNQSCKVSSYPIPDKSIDSYCIDDFERLLVRHMKPLVDEADRSGHFDCRLIEQMDFMCALWTQHFFDLYAHIPHPHTGQTLC
ncbi:hypothetical protein WS71_17035 [Burkholderia mayonis]|uniref:Uncharacterized protein n=2 Tax=Burkholderia mayonis TaxID=1385591 RepID=A0A1B4G7B1_9BURK|nr:hypothetical protein WS71_17035 [Burkholderia mayonis]KVE56165.1 hypothetical protein WS71_29465 [Burkholderia mayonis]